MSVVAIVIAVSVSISKPDRFALRKAAGSELLAQRRGSVVAREGVADHSRKPMHVDLQARAGLHARVVGQVARDLQADGFVDRRASLTSVADRDIVDPLRLHQRGLRLLEAAVERVTKALGKSLMVVLVVVWW